MLNFLQGYKTVVFFTITGLLGLVVALEAIDFQAILLPLVCHVDPSALEVGNTCVDKIVSLSGKIVAGISAVGIFLRAVTTSPIFLTLFAKDK